MLTEDLHQRISLVPQRECVFAADVQAPGVTIAVTGSSSSVTSTQK